MALDPSISLAVQVPQVAPPDLNKTMLTYGQLKYLMDEGARVQAQTGLLQTQQQQAQMALAGEQRARQVAANAPPDMDTPTLARQLIAADPWKGGEAAKSLFEQDSLKLQQDEMKLKLASSHAGFVANALESATPESWGFVRSLLGSRGVDVSKIPETYSPDAQKGFVGLSRTAQQRAEEALKVQQQKIDQQRAENERVQAEATTMQAETQQRIAKRPYTLGTGYARDQDVPEPTMVGGGGQRTQAPRSPEGQAYYNTLSSQFEAGSRTFAEATEAYNRLAATAKEKTSTGDRALLQAFVKLTDPGQVVGASFAKETQGLGTIREQAVSEYNRLLDPKAGTMAPELRQKFVETAKRIHAIQIDQHLQMRDEIRQKATNQVGPEAALEVAPNRLTTYGSGGKALSPEKFQEYLQHARNKGKTRGEALLDLADKGFYVQGGPR